MKFWEKVTLEEMTDQQWESLCDGCGLCCLHRFEDIETLKMEYTCVKCRYLNAERHCTVYANRTNKVSGCLNIRDLPKTLYRWLPETCAYRRINESRSLPNWHPLITGSTVTMETSRHAVGNWAISDDGIDVDEDFIIKMRESES